MDTGHEVEAARRFHEEGRRKVAALRAVLPPAHACHYLWFTQSLGEGDDVLDVFVHELTGEYLEIAQDGTVYVWREGVQARTDETQEQMLRRLLPSREAWLEMGGYGRGGVLAENRLSS